MATFFQVPPDFHVAGTGDYAWYACLGLRAVSSRTILPELFYRVRDAFALYAIPPWTKPAIGGFGLGLMALRLPQVLGGGYGWIQEAIKGELALQLLLLLVIAKMVASRSTVSSGGSGGVFAPSLFVGWMLEASSPGVSSTSGGPRDCWNGSGIRRVQGACRSRRC